MSFGQRLKKVYKTSRLNQDEFSEILGISKSILAKYFKNESKPGLEVIQNLLNHFSDMNPRWLLFGEESGHYNNSGNIIKTVNEPEGQYDDKLKQLEKENSKLKDQLILCKNELIEALKTNKLK